MKLIFIFASFLCVVQIHGWQKSGSLYQTVSGKVSFTSYAPLETIQASSNQLQGIIDIESREFAFSVSIRSFDGFNSPLQQEHFNENYLESNTFPRATFTGRIIEKINFKKNGTYRVRAKGKFNVHGINQERIVISEIKITEDRIHLTADFTILLKEHNIIVPRIVHQKISSEILVKVEAVLNKNENL